MGEVKATAKNSTASPEFVGSPMEFLFYLFKHMLLVQARGRYNLTKRRAASQTNQIRHKPVKFFSRANTR
jgi:hypothetical protein